MAFVTIGSTKRNVSSVDMFTRGKLLDTIPVNPYICFEEYPPTKDQLALGMSYSEIDTLVQLYMHCTCSSLPNNWE